MNISEAIKHLNEKKKDFESIREKAEYIEKAELIKKICLETAVGYCSPTIKTIKEFPAADVQPVSHGRWIDIYEWAKMHDSIPSGTCLYYWCSECQKEQEKKSNFCPHCGTRMDLGDEKT